MSEISMLSEKDAELIANYLLKNGIQSFGTKGFYNTIQRVAVKLGNIENVNGISSGVALVLSNEDYLKVTNKIWCFITKGYLAPGVNYSNPWFPHVHLTENGKTYLKSIE